jgi:hypothetical protein
MAAKVMTVLLRVPTLSRFGGVYYVHLVICESYLCIIVRKHSIGLKITNENPNY